MNDVLQGLKREVCIPTVKQVNTIIQQLLFPQHTFVIGSVEQEKPTITAIGLPLGEEARGGGGQSPLQYFFYLRIVFWGGGYCVEEGQIKKCVGESGREMCVCILSTLFNLTTS